MTEGVVCLFSEHACLFPGERMSVLLCEKIIIKCYTALDEAAGEVQSYDFSGKIEQRIRKEEEI